MRIVYDDTMQGEMTEAVGRFMAAIDVKRIMRHELGMERIQMHILREKLNLFLEQYRMSIGGEVTNAHGIGNNCKYPVYYYPEDSREIQKCGYININTGMYGEGYVSCEDHNGNLTGVSYKVDRCGIKRG